jgi:hypothetical protein
MPWVLSGCRISSNLTNERKQHVGGDTRRLFKANKGPKGAKGKANRRGYGCAPQGLPSQRKIDNAALGAVANLRSETELLLYVEKQCEQAEEVVADAEEESRGRHRPAADGRSVVAADRPCQCSATQPGYDRSLKHFRSGNFVALQKMKNR